MVFAYSCLLFKVVIPVFVIRQSSIESQLLLSRMCVLSRITTVFTTTTWVKYSRFWMTTISWMMARARPHRSLQEQRKGRKYQAS